MKATGYTRKVDSLGRIVLPKSLRKQMDIAINDDIKFLVDGDMVVIKKYEPSCIFCDTEENVSKYRGKYICSKCMDELRK
jgi:transcriptional pleiotropic regulator of transition state genes